jgi:hypothetical protein
MAQSWLSLITPELLARVGSRAPSSLPSGPGHVQTPRSASDFAASRPLPPASRAGPMFVPVSQRSPSDPDLAP